MSFLVLSTGMVPQGWGQVRQDGAERLAAKASDLVDIREINPRIVVDMKYASEDNFTKQQLYETNVCFLRRSTALKLDGVQKELEGLDLGLKVWDCYRPLAAQRTLWALLPDERYVANPKKGSRHNRGSAVDATLVDSRGVELQMPTGFDEFSARAHRHYQNLPEQVIRHRSLLETSMKKAGFLPLPEEWWHFDDETGSDFEVLDVPFRDLLKHSNESNGRRNYGRIGRRRNIPLVRWAIAGRRGGCQDGFVKRTDRKHFERGGGQTS